MNEKRTATFLIHFAIISYIFFVVLFAFFAIDFLVYDIHNILLLVGFAQGIYLSAFAVFLINRYKIFKKDIEDVKKVKT